MILNGTAQFYDAWRLRESKDVNLSTDTFKMLLVDDSYVPDFAAHAVLADITGEISGNGYARQTLGSVLWDDSSGKPRFSFDQVTFEATTGPWVARRWVLFDDTLADKPLMAGGLLNADDADVTVTAGNELSFTMPAGYFFERTS